MPGLINAHSHIELAPLKWRLSPTGSFMGWVRNLIEARSRIESHEWIPAIEESIDSLFQDGVIGVGDVGNLDFINDIVSDFRRTWPFRGIFFREMINPTADAGSIPDIGGLPAMSETKKSGNISGRNGFGFTVSAHAPYSVSPWLLQEIKAWNRARGFPFAIHAAESLEEMEFLRSGTGPVRDFLEERCHWPLNYRIPSTTPVRYLHSLGLLDRNTICVHAVHLDSKEISLLASTGASVCLCPRSNMFLGVGIPQAEDLHRAGIPLALGTDSLASNDRLSIFAEMASLTGLAPGLSPVDILEAATAGGAWALGLSHRLGSLSPGKDAVFLALRSDRLPVANIVEFLVSEGSRDHVECYVVDESTQTPAA